MPALFIERWIYNQQDQSCDCTSLIMLAYSGILFATLANRLTLVKFAFLFRNYMWTCTIASCCITQLSLVSGDHLLSKSFRYCSKRCLQEFGVVEGHPSLCGDEV